VSEPLLFDHYQPTGQAGRANGRTTLGVDVSWGQGVPPFSRPKLLANERHENQLDERRGHEVISARGDRFAQCAVPKLNNMGLPWPSR
jgi:hypothetical protein